MEVGSVWHAFWHSVATSCEIPLGGWLQLSESQERRQEKLEESHQLILQEVMAEEAKVGSHSYIFPACGG